MIDFKAIEFFFGKEKTHIIPSPLKERKKEIFDAEGGKFIVQNGKATII